MDRILKAATTGNAHRGAAYRRRGGEPRPQGGRRVAGIWTSDVRSCPSPNAVQVILLSVGRVSVEPIIVRSSPEAAQGRVKIVKQLLTWAYAIWDRTPVRRPTWCAVGGPNRSITLTWAGGECWTCRQGGTTEAQNPDPVRCFPSLHATPHKPDFDAALGGRGRSL